MSFPPQSFGKIKTDLVTTLADLVTIKANLADILEELAHPTYIFPEGSNETVTFTAGAVANAWSAWTEIADNNGITLSSKFAAKEGHLSAINLEVLNTINNRYMIELAYGAAKTLISPLRFQASIATIGLSTSTDIRTSRIPAGEKVYHRTKCETGAATVQLHFRYHFHNGA